MPKKTREQELEEDWAKGCLVTVSLIIGIAIIVATLTNGWNPGSGVLLGLIAAIFYPILGAIVVSLCEEMLTWAFQGRAKWDVAEKAGFGAFWPITLIFCMIISLFYGIINRLFK